MFSTEFKMKKLNVEFHSYSFSDSEITTAIAYDFS